MDCPPAETEEFETVDDMLNCEYFQKWKSDPKFTKFVRSEDLVLCILNDGFTWWVLGRCYGDISDLPNWEGGKYKAKMEDGTEKVLTKKEVSGSRGDTLFLLSGGEATWICP